MIPMNSITTYINVFMNGINLKICSSLVALIFTFFFSISISAATTVVAIRTEKSVFIGADSKIGDSSKRCKISQAGDVFFAFAGYPIIMWDILNVPHSPIKKEAFNIYKIIAEIELMNAPIAKKVETFESITRDTLTKILEITRQNDPVAFCRRFVEGDKPTLSVIIAGVDHAVPVLYGREFRITTKCEEPVVLAVTPMNDINLLTPGKVQVILYGAHEVILEKRPSSLNIDRIEEVINKWITWEIIAHPDAVGPPIDILRITDRKAEWIQHKPECKEIQ